MPHMRITSKKTFQACNDTMFFLEYKDKQKKFCILSTRQIKTS